MAKYPIYLDLSGTLAVIVGAGTVAARKVKKLLAAGANVKIITKKVSKEFEDSCKDLGIEILESEYSADYLDGVFLVIAATDDKKLNTRIYNDCTRRQILCNVVDVPELCSFYVPSIVKRGDLQIAISTNGKCPAYAAHLRRSFEKIITEDHARFLDCLDEIRKKIISSGLPLSRRKNLLVKLSDDESFNKFLDKGPESWMLNALKELSGKLNEN